MSLLDTTITVRRGGSYLTVPANAADKYLAKGFDIVDEAGNVIKESVPNDVNSLKAAYNKHIAKIKELEDTIKALKAQLEVAEPVAAPAKASSTAKRGSKKS